VFFRKKKILEIKKVNKADTKNQIVKVELIFNKNLERRKKHMNN
jgi:hypothetical protein